MTTVIRPNCNPIVMDHRYYLFNESNKISLLNSETNTFIDITGVVGDRYVGKGIWRCNKRNDFNTSYIMISVIDKNLYILKAIENIVQINPNPNNPSSMINIAKSINIIITKYDISFDKIKEVHELNINVDNTKNDQSFGLSYIIPTRLKPKYLVPINTENTLIVDFEKMIYVTVNGNILRSYILEPINDRVIVFNNQNSKTSILFDILTWEQSQYIGNMSEYINDLSKKNYYLLDCDPPKIVYKYKPIKSNTIEFSTSIVNDKIYIYAHNEEKTKEYEIFIIPENTKLELLYEKISDAIGKQNCDVSYTYEMTDKHIELIIEIKVRYYYETLKYMLERKPYNELELLRKEVDYLRKKLGEFH